MRGPAAPRKAGIISMPLVTLVSLALALGICLVPVWLLRHRRPGRAQDYLVASQYTRPEVVRNSSIAYALRMVAFVPLFAWGASGEIWPAVIASAFFGLGVYLIYILREPLLAFLDGALSGDRSITVHEFVAQQHNNDRRVRLLAASLTLFSLLGLLACEAAALAVFLKPMLQGHAATYLLALGALLVVVSCATLSGHSGIMHSTQLQLGMLYLGMFGATVLLLYLHLSARTPLPPSGSLAVVFAAVFCVIVLVYRRSKYVDTDPIRSAAPSAGAGRDSACASALSRFGKILNICLSVLLVLIIVVALMEIHAAGWAAIARDSAAALRAGTGVPGVGLVALSIVPLFYPLADVTNWLRLAATRSEVAGVEAERRSAALRGLFRMYAAETCLMWLFMCVFGAIAAAAVGAPSGTNVLQTFVANLVSADNGPNLAVLSLLLIVLIAAALSTMGALFSAILCTIRYDMLLVLWPGRTQERDRASKEPAARRRTLFAGAALGVAFGAALCVADAFFQIDFASNTFLAALLALCCAQLSLAPLVVGPLVARGRDRATLGPGWALVILGSGVAGGVAAVTAYFFTGAEAWLWSASLICLGSGLVPFGIARAAAARRSA